MLYRLLRRLTVRGRIVGGFGLFLLMLAASLPIVISSNLTLVTRLQQLTDTDIRIDRLLLLASRDVLAARVNLQRYNNDLVPSPSETLSNIAAAKNSLQDASALMSTLEDREPIERIIGTLDEYDQTVRNIQRARVEGRLSDVEQSIFRTAFLGNDIDVQISQVLQKSEERVVLGNLDVLDVARSRMLLVVGVYIGLLLLALGLGYALERSINRPVVDLQAGAEQFRIYRRRTSIPEDGNDELSLLARLFNQMSDELSTLYASLENQVLERVRALKTSTEISRRLSTILDRQRLIVDVVDEIQQAFDYYHVHIYLFDNERQNLMIAGGTGEAGQAMLSAGHSVPLGRGLVGRSAASKQQVVVQDTTTEPTWLPNPLLPDTRSEVVIPIIVGENVLGVLDVQHNIQDGFPDQEIELLQAIANQVAIALQNAEQYAQTQLALRQASEEEARFRAIFEGSNDAIMLLDEKGFFDCNDQTLELFGFESRDDFLRCTPADVSPSYQPDGAESNTAVQERVQRAFQEGYNRFDWMHKRVNDVEFPAEVLLSAFDLSGRRVLQATVRDLTERKQAQDALAKQVSELARVAEIGALATSVLEPTELLQRVSNLVRDGFGLYHAHIYLISESENVLILAAGAGEVGLEMVRQGWRIPANSERSLVAQAARRLEGVIANDVRSELDFLPNPLLPNTASEMAVPLVVGDQLLGVLDVQSEQVEYFTPADVSIQLTLASQIAVALQNARRYSQIRESEQLVRTIIDATPDWIFIKDQEHRYRLVNRGYGNSLHIPPEEFIGKNDLELGFPEELVLGNPEKGIEGFWADDRRVMESGQAQSIPNDLVMIDGMPHIFNTLKIPLKDDTGQVWGVLAFARDITERERLQRETEERLEEVNALYRTLSRESWEQYRQTSRKDYAFIFDRNSVQEAGNQWIEETISAMRNNSIEALPNQPVTVAPLTLRGDVIGALAVQTSPEDPLSEDELLLLREMTEQIALALESARLFVQTQQALGETETLYQIIADMNSAIDYDQILGAIQQRTILQDANQLLLAVFNQPINVHSETTPEWLYPVAFRTDSRVKVAQRYPIEAFESKPGVIFTNHAVVIKKVDSDQRLDKVTRTLFKDVFRAHDTIVIPLILGEQIIGFLQAFYEGPTDFLVSEIQSLSAVASQAAIAVQSRLLLEQAQQRARQEARIREVTSQIFSASDVDSIMRRAVEQVGRTLEAKAFVYLNPTGQATLENQSME